MVVEGAPLHVRGETAEDKENRRKANPEKLAGDKKPVALGALAVEAKPEPSETRQRPEHIGHMLLANEPESDRRSKEEHDEKKDLLIESPIEPATGKRVDTMSREELLTLGGSIEIDGSDLRKIFESHLIGERGLRRLVAEHLRGGNLRKALKREVLEREMDFERDPAMRDTTPVTLPTGGSNPSLDSLLKHADVNMGDQSEQAAFVKARARYQAEEGKRKRHGKRRVADIALVALIVILTVLVIILYLVRQ